VQAELQYFQAVEHDAQTVSLSICTVKLGAQSQYLHPAECDAQTVSLSICALPSLVHSLSICTQVNVMHRL
jgi:hypothetical protein